MKSFLRSVVVGVFSLFVVIAFSVPGQSAEIDDSTVFVEAFNAYQQKDYLLTIEKCDQLNQVFPESPLRDVTLLLIARASLKSGNNERAAKSVTLFTKEFPESRLKTSVEDELMTLAHRYQKGDVLAADKTLQAVARQVSNDRIARQRAAEMKLEMERIAKAKAEQERLAKIKLEEERLEKERLEKERLAKVKLEEERLEKERLEKERLAKIKLEEERREKERLLAEKLAKENIKIAISLRNDAGSFPIGSSSVIPLEITNRGNSSEELLLNISAAREYGVILTKPGKPDESVTRLQLASGETFKGSLHVRMPFEMVDGHRSLLSVHAVSAKFSDIAFKQETVVICSAPLVRAVAKLVKPKVTPGEKLSYRVAVLNAGSQSAQNLTVRLQLPPQIDFQGGSDTPFKQESNGALVFTVDKVDIGQLVQINLDVKVRENTSIGQELRGQVEVESGGLQKKEVFVASASVVIAPK
ncbi:MAG TPA: DUF11 domain-containing protein [Desulfuromonadales bacterium]|nr:DUF11 domain-containing protein [Desulfuromonadales bacterium]